MKKSHACLKLRSMNTELKNNKANYLILLLTSILLLSACSTTSTTIIDDVKDTQAVIVREGIFEDADASHKGSGVLKVLQKDSELTVRFEDFEGTAGPGLVVLLVENVNGKNKSEIGSFLELGPLKSTNGNQNYTVPEGTDLSKYTGVMVYCKPFSVIFSRAAFK